MGGIVFAQSYHSHAQPSKEGFPKVRAAKFYNISNKKKIKTKKN
jgi:hypothetical protein